MGEQSRGAAFVVQPDEGQSELQTFDCDTRTLISGLRFSPHRDFALNNGSGT